MSELRKLSARPELLTDTRARTVEDPATTNRVGQQNDGRNLAAWFGRQRIVSALPMAEPPRWIRPHTVLHAQNQFYLADTDGTLVGMQGLWCNRILSARYTEDTRRIGG